MSRQDNAPGQMPLTHGLQINVTGSSEWQDFQSGQAGFASDSTFQRCRIDPKLLTGRLKAVQLQFQAATAVEYSSGVKDGVAGLPTKDNGGVATFATQTFYQPLWLGAGEFYLSIGTATDAFNYQLIMRLRPLEEQDAGE